MKTKLFLLGALLCGTVAFTACNDDDDHYTPGDKVVNEFNTKYPQAKNVTWETKAGYNVADFFDGDYETEAWFNEQGLWVMTETDIPYAALPAAVKQSFETSLYKDWRVDDVDKLERSDTDGPVYVIEVEQGETDVDLYYSETGVLIKEIKDQDNEEGYQPVTIPEELVSFINTQYPGALILEFEREKNSVEIDILDGKIHKEVTFALTNEWLKTEWEVRYMNLPPAVRVAVDNAYAGYEIDDDADYVETPAGNYYLIEVERNDQEKKVKFDAEGNELK